MSAAIAVTGAAGFIGSHAALALLERGERVLGIDDLSRGNPGAVEVLRRTGGERFEFIQCDVGSADAIGRALRRVRPEVLLHFAALTYVGESVQEPMRYWRVNCAAAITLLQTARDAGLSKFVFSSTCATYGVPGGDEEPARPGRHDHRDPVDRPISEHCAQVPINPYGRAKLAFERALLDEHDAPPSKDRPPLSIAILRYFNVAGSDPRSRLGEDHRPETHLIPICLDVALGRRQHVEIFGEDYPTPDGTCIRDYVHVSDLIDAHLLAVDRLAPGRPIIANVGIGRGFSVREVIDACRRVTGAAIPVRSAPRRAGDPPSLVADASRIRGELGWVPRFTALDETVASAWAWRSKHPDGYA